MDCIFCKIANGEIKTDIVYQDDAICAFKDAAPQAPVHFLVVPKSHIASAKDLSEKDSALCGKIFAKISEITAEMGCDNGYRVVTNVGEDGGQTVQHLHFHVLAKRSLAWPPG